MLGTGAEATAFFSTAYTMCIDMYKTFIPVKRTTFAMAMAIAELTARITGQHLDKAEAFAASRKQYNRAAVMETMLDLLDLYVQHHKATKIGTQFDLARFIDIKIQLNNDLDKTADPRYLYHCQKCEIDEPQPSAPGGPPMPGETSVRRTARGQDGTMRFVFDPEAAKAEQETVGTFFKEEFEEYEVEVEEPVPPPQDYHPPREGGQGRGGRGHHNHGHGHARGGYRGGHWDRGDRRGGPYFRGDRHHRGRGRFH
jgi:CTD kinase subunit beta